MMMSDEASDKWHVTNEGRRKSEEGRGKRGELLPPLQGEGGVGMGFGEHASLTLDAMERTAPPIPTLTLPLKGRGSTAVASRVTHDSPLATHNSPLVTCQPLLSLSNCHRHSDGTTIRLRI